MNVKSSALLANENLHHILDSNVLKSIDLAKYLAASVEMPSQRHN